MFHFSSNGGDSTMDDLFIRSNRAVSVEPNPMNRRHLCHQKSLPNESTIENRYSKLKQFDNHQTFHNGGTPPGFHMQPRTHQNGSSDSNPAFTIRRHILNEKEDNIQLEQMKRVRLILSKTFFSNFTFF